VGTDRGRPVHQPWWPESLPCSPRTSVGSCRGRIPPRCWSLLREQRPRRDVPRGEPGAGGGPRTETRSGRSCTPSTIPLVTTLAHEHPRRVLGVRAQAPSANGSRGCQRGSPMKARSLSVAYGPGNAAGHEPDEHGGAERAACAVRRCSPCRRTSRVRGGGVSVRIGPATGTNPSSRVREVLPRPWCQIDERGRGDRVLLRDHRADARLRYRPRRLRRRRRRRVTLRLAQGGPPCARPCRWAQTLASRDEARAAGDSSLSRRGHERATAGLARPSSPPIRPRRCASGST
jgi:hypothetical protein